MKMFLTIAVLLSMMTGAYAAENAPDLAVLPADFRGVVLYPDGETPNSNLRVWVWNTDTEEVVYKTRTDKNGVFSIPKLPEGAHYVTVGPVRIDVRTLTGRAGVTPQTHGMVIVVPKRSPATILLPTAVGASTFVPQIMSP